MQINQAPSGVAFVNEACSKDEEKFDTTSKN